VKRGIWILLFALVMLGAIGWYAKRSLDRRNNWEEVSKAAARVESGIRHETLIALRSKVADLDAAVNNYARLEGLRDSSNRVAAIHNAVDTLEWAIENEKTQIVRDGTQDFEFYSSRLYLNVEPKCSQQEGEIYVSGPELARASLTYARQTLINPDNAPVMRKTDLVALRIKCTADAQAYKKQVTEASETKRLEHLRAWPLHVDVAVRGYDQAISSIKADGREVDSYVYGSRHIDARQYVDIECELCMEPPNVSFVVNGKKYTPQWTDKPDDTLQSFHTFTVRIVPP
jgi:hypothetical protein